MMSWLLTTAQSMRSDRRGNVAMIFALSAIPLIGMTGLAVDYSLMLSTKTRLDQAADSAAVAGVAGAKAYITAYTGTGDPSASATSAGQSLGQAQFNANTGKLPSGTLTTSSIVVTRNKQVITATVTYTYQMPTFFMSVLGTRTMSVKGTSVSTMTMPTYVNVYVLVDNSASMGIGATAADQTIVYNNTTGNCALTCHYVSSGGTDTVTQAHSAGATLRMDVAKSAIYSGLQQILNAQSSSNPTYQVAVYTLSSQFTQVFPTGCSSPCLSTNIQGAMNAVGKDYTSGIDMTKVNKDGGTDTTYALTQLAKNLPTSGDGSTSAKAQGFVILVTDGVQDSDTKVLSNGSYVDQSSSNFTAYNPCNTPNCTYNSNFKLYFQSFDSSQCKQIKNLNYTMMTLNVQYLIPPSNQQGSNQQLQDVFTFIQNNLSSTIATNLTACATSSSYAYSASTPADITAATKAIFAAIPAAAVARLSQ